MTTSAKIVYKVLVKLTATIVEGCSISTYRSTPTVYVSVDSDFEITPETMPDFVRLVRQQVSLQTFFCKICGDNYHLWVESYTPCP
jgi:hypothetical protein